MMIADRSVKSMIAKLLAVLCLCLPAVGAPPAAGEQDAILTLDAKYKEWRSDPEADSTGGRQAGYEAWLARYQKAIADDPDSPAVPLARDRIVRLLYDLNRRHEALALWEASRQEDPIVALHAEYGAQQRAQGVGQWPPGERRAFYEKWLARFEEVVRDNPYSPWVHSAYDARLELYNVLGRYRESLAILEVMLNEAEADWQRRNYLMQIGEVARDAALVENDEGLAKKSIECFQKVRELTNRADTRMYTLVREAGVEALCLKNHARAAELYMQAYGLLPSVEEQEHPDPCGSCNAEDLLSYATVEYAKAGNAERALEVFRQLAEVPEEDLSRTVYLTMILGEARWAGRAGWEVICPYAQKWLDQHADDPHAPTLANNLGYAWMEAGQTRSAIGSFERALEYAAQPDALHPLAVRSLYEQLAKLYTRVGDAARATEMRKRLKELKAPNGR